MSLRGLTDLGSAEGAIAVWEARDPGDREGGRNNSVEKRQDQEGARLLHLRFLPMIGVLGVRELQPGHHPAACTSLASPTPTSCRCPVEYMRHHFLIPDQRGTIVLRYLKKALSGGGSGACGGVKEWMLCVMKRTPLTYLFCISTYLVWISRNGFDAERL